MVIQKITFSASEILQLVIASLGLLGILFQSIVIYITSRRRDRPNKDPNTSNFKIVKFIQKLIPSSRKYKLMYIIIAILFVVMIVPGIKIINKKYFLEPSLKMLVPHNNSYVKPVIDIHGKYRNIDPSEQLIWVSVFSYVDNKYFLHDKPADLNNSKHEWRNKNTVIGTSNDSNEKFIILALLVDYNSESYKRIHQYLDNVNRHGLSKLPEGCSILSETKVIIK